MMRFKTTTCVLQVAILSDVQTQLEYCDAPGIQTALTICSFKALGCRALIMKKSRLSEFVRIERTRTWHEHNQKDIIH
jgi:hypothetical protein